MKAKKIVILFFLFFLISNLNAQQKNSIARGTKDSLKVRNLLSMADSCIKKNGTGCSAKLDQALSLSLSLNSNYLTSFSYQLLAKKERKYRSELLHKYNLLALENARKTKNDSLVFYCLAYMCHDKCTDGKPEEVINAVNELYETGKKHPDRLINMLAEYEYGYYQQKKVDFDAARNKFMNALAIANSINNKNWIALLKRAIFQSETLGYYTEKQVTYIYDAVEYFTKKPDPLEVATCSMVISKSYMILGNIQKAISYAQEAAAIYKHYGYPAEEADAYANIAEACVTGKMIERGFYAAKRSLSLFSSLNYLPGKIRGVINYARLHAADSNYIKADSLFAIADSLLKKNEDKRLRFFYMGCVVERYRLAGKLDDIYFFTVDAAKLQREVMPSYLIERFVKRAYKNGLLSEKELEDITKFSKTGELDTLIWNKKKNLDGFNNLTVNLPRFDSNYNALYNRQLNEAETKYKTRVVKDSLNLLKYQNKISDLQLNRQYWVLGFGSLFTLAVLVLLIQINRSKKRISKEKERAEEDAAKIAFLSKEIKHRVKNHQQTIQSLIRMTGYQSTDKESFRTLEQRIEPLTAVDRFLDASISPSVNLQTYYTLLTEPLNESYGAGKNIKINIEAAIELEGEKAKFTGFIVNELITNSFKHAFKNRSAGTINIYARKEPTGNYYLAVSDDGQGFYIAKSSTVGLGSQLIKGFAEQLSATTKISNEEGAKFEFWFL